MMNGKSCLRMAVMLIAVALPPWSLAAEGEVVYGEGVTGPETLPIQNLLARPDGYVGKTVRVAGRITDVCPRRGCWIEIAGDGEESVRFKVDDGVIVFPTTIRGRQVVAEGLFTKTVLEGDAAVEYARHMAEEQGETFNPSTVQTPLTLYRIQGNGAVVR